MARLMPALTNPKHERLRQLVTFENYCTCGGYAWQMNGRPEASPHMDWCPQREEYARWYAAKLQEANKAKVA